MSCGCPDGIKKNLWSTFDLSGDSKFDFNTAYLLKSKWCQKHGNEYCEAILALDHPIIKDAVPFRNWFGSATRFLTYI